jgi:nucleoside phosphorylase
MRILVTFAVDAEFAPWRKLRKFVRLPAEGLDLWKSTTSNTELFVLLTGIGEQSAAHAMDLALRFANYEGYFDVCVSSGLSGALRSEHKVGEILAARSVLTNVVHADIKSDSIPTDSALLDLAKANGAKGVGVFYTAERVATTMKDKAGIASFADAVDMESFGIMKEAHAWGMRPIAIRAVSDGADKDLPIDFNRTINSSNQVSIPRVLAELAKKPGALPALIEFGKQSRRAAEALAGFLDKFVDQLASDAKNHTNVRVAV